MTFVGVYAYWILLQGILGQTGKSTNKQYIALKSVTLLPTKVIANRVTLSNVLFFLGNLVWRRMQFYHLSVLRSSRTLLIAVLYVSCLVEMQICHHDEYQPSDM